MIAGLISDMLAAAPLPRLTPRNTASQSSRIIYLDQDGFELASGRSSAGILVDHDTALSLAPVWQAVWMISGDMAGLTLNVFKRLADDDREIDRQHPAETLVSMRANHETSAWELWRRLMVHALLWGDGYAYIERAGGRRGKPTALINLLPDRTEPKWDSSVGLYYETTVDGKKEVLFKEEVLHVKGLSVENGVALDLVEYARDAFGVALAAEGLIGQFYKDGAQSGGVLEVPPTMSEPALKKLDEGFAKRYNDKSKRFSVLVLRDGAKWQATTINAEQSQQHELRTDQIIAVAQYFNLPPYKLGVTDSATPAKTADEAQRVYLSSCLSIWRMAIATECQMKLLSEAEIAADSHYFEHNVSNFIEMDPIALGDLLEQQRRNEVINANDWRRKVNLPKRTDPGGDEYGNPNTKSTGATKDPATDGSGDPAAGDAGHADSQGAAQSGDVQATALNGAQIASLLLVVQDVAGGRMPADGAKIVLHVSFPLIDEKLLDAIIDSLKGFEQKQPEKTADAGGQPPRGKSAESNATDLALRALFGDTINRVARRVAFDARSAAKKPAKFLGWLDGGAAEHRAVFAATLRPVIEAVVAVRDHGVAGDADDLLAVVAEGFFADILPRLSQLVEPPNVQARLPENVDAACVQFESTIAAALEKTVFGEAP